MNIVFKTIEINNFTSFGTERFDFRVNSGMNLIKGVNHDANGDANGAGKSQLFNALLYALFGQLQNKIKNENVVNRFSDSKDMDLVLTFSVDGAEYKIRRGLQKGKLSYFNLYRTRDGEEEDITKSTIQETQDYLQKNIIRCDVTIFLRTVLLTADHDYNFYMMKKSDKKEFVEKLFDISVFGEMYQLIHKDLLTTDREMAALQNQLMILNRNDSDYKTRLDRYETDKKDRQTELETEIENKKNAYSEIQKHEAVVNQDEVDKIQTAVDKLEKARQECSARINTEQANKQKTEIGLSKIQAQIDAKTSAISGHSEILRKLCEDCRPIFKDYYDIDDIQAEIRKLEEAKEEFTQKAYSFDKAIADLKATDQKYFDKLQLGRKKIYELTADAIKHARAVSQTQAEIAGLEKQLSRLKMEVNPYIEMLENNKKQMDSTSDDARKHEIRHNYLKFAEGIVSQDTLRKFIIKDLVVLLNNRIKTYLTRLGAKYFVVFDENMDFDFIVENGGSWEYNNFSAGERMRIMIATSFAFRDFMSIRNGFNANILFLDEYFDSAISSQCVENTLKILKEYSDKYKQNIFIISHRPEVNMDFFDRTITISKKNRTSSIVYS